MVTPRRVLGLETEYGISYVAPGGIEPPMSAEDAAERLFAEAPAGSSTKNAFLENGSRLYLDIGAHPEYATAEADSIDDLVAADRAGEAIMARMAARANHTLTEEGKHGRLHLFRNNEDAAGHTFGCHENYMLRRRPDYENQIERLVPFLVTRQIVVGSGFVHRLEDGSARYELSSRSYEMWEALSLSSTRTRPMINTRDEPHADAAKLRRMHVIVGDSNMSEVTTGLKVAIMEAMVTMLEEGALIPNFALADPMHAIRQVSADITGRATLELRDGGTATALDIQRAMRDAVLRYYERRGYLAELDPTRRALFELWGRVLDAVTSGSLDDIAADIDWVAKLRLLSRYRARSGADWTDPRVARLELAYHDITAAGLRDKLESAGLMRRLVAREAVDHALTTPPQTTRAKIRGAVIAAARDHHRDIAVDWSTIAVPGVPHRGKLSLPDPLAASDAAADALIDAMGR